MKKCLLLICVILIGISVEAQEHVFTDDLVVTIDGTSTPPQSTTISLTETGNGEYTLSLKNFKLGSGDEAVPVGSIILEGVRGETNTGGITAITFNDNITIQAGDEAGVDGWLGPNLGLVPIDMAGEFTSGKLSCTINIDMTSTLGQVIKVEFGKELSSIQEVKMSDNGKVDVYTLGGILVRRQIEAASAVKDLPQGIYIVNGKKVMVNPQ